VVPKAATIRKNVGQKTEALHPTGNFTFPESRATVQAAFVAAFPVVLPSGSHIHV
jgi:hypothetical protein